ncbi:MAG TPA: TRAP transporter small permease subunit [Stellaceae bacterium]
MIASVERLARIIARGLAVAGLGLLLCFAVATVADGLLRFFFAHPIDTVNDLGGFIAAVSVASCMPLVMLERGNITIRFVATFIGPRAGRVADICAAILMELILIAMAWQFYRYAATAAADGSATWMLHIATAPFWWLVDAMIWAAVAMQAIVTVRYLWGGMPDTTHQPVA